MKEVRVILLLLAVVFIAIQFIPSGMPATRPDDEKSIIHSGLANEAVLDQLRTSCFDCHSNQTQLPWYARIAPSSWILANHIKDGREDLNFSDWNDYSRRKKVSSLEKIKDEVEKGRMPLKSYTLIHRKAKLGPEKISALSKWAEEASAGFFN